MIDPSNAATPPNVTRNLSDAACGAVLALASQIEAHEQFTLYHHALRSIVAERLYAEYTAPALDGSVAPPRSATGLIVACAALSNGGAQPDPLLTPITGTLRSLLGSGRAENFGGLCDIATALDHQHEHWDGAGVPQGIGGVAIPLAARILSVARVLVGAPADGELPDWNAARAQVRDRAGEALDPSLCQALERVDLDDITPPQRPLEVIASLMNQPADRASRAPGSKPATTISTAVTLAGRIPDLLNLFADTARTSVDAAEVLIFRASDTHLDSTPAARVTDGQRPPVDPERLDDLFEFAMQAELLAGETVLRDTTRPDADTDGHSIDEIVTPIMVDAKPWGVLVATRRRTAASFADVDVAQLQHISSEIAVAARSTTHWAQMEEMALKDQLTGLGNRHDLYRVLDRIFERPPAERMDSALIMCDVDGLKVVNDTQGHQAGDRLLVDAAEALRGAVRNREGTTVCRIGGDEFCVVVDGGALLTVHEISDAIERLFARSAGSGPARSISCGVAVADHSIDSRSALLRAADENQYETKRERKRSLKGARRSAIPPNIGRLDSADRRAIRD